MQSFCRSKAESPKDKLGEIKKQAPERHKVSCLELNLPSSLLKAPTNALTQTGDSRASNNTRAKGEFVVRLSSNVVHLLDQQ